MTQATKKLITEKCKHKMEASTTQMGDLILPVVRCKYCKEIFQVRNSRTWTYVAKEQT